MQAHLTVQISCHGTGQATVDIQHSYLTRSFSGLTYNAKTILVNNMLKRQSESGIMFGDKMYIDWRMDSSGELALRSRAGWVI